jgi:hypothetical protein
MLNRINRIFNNRQQGFVFILSARRTGSTLLQNILCQSPQTHAFVSEAQILTRLLDAFQWGDGEFSRMVAPYFGTGQTYLQFQKETVDRFLKLARKNLNVKKLMILKNPEFAPHTEKLVNLLPAARFLVLVRDPRDQITSEIAVSQRQIDLNWKQQVPSMEELCAAYDHCYTYIEHGRQQNPAAFLTVRYEDLVSHTASILKVIERFLSIDLSTYDSNADWKNTKVDWDVMKKRPSWSEYYGKPLSGDPVGSYAEKLDSDQVKEIEDRLAIWMHAYDYSPIHKYAKGECQD